ncbi:MAG: hypothetical protein OER87_20850 [Gammaproteobacteria bacterium]|nr:hypothetical protein [Gammaproteobacteria bacterium]
MNYQDVKIQLLKEAPQIPFRPIAIEAAMLVCGAGILLHLYA